MVSAANPRPDARQVCVLFVALLWAVSLLALAPGAGGETGPRPTVDRDPEGSPYVAGELLVAYEPGTSENAQRAVVRASGGRTAEDLPGNTRLVSFPAVAQERSKESRGQALRRKLENLRDAPGVEAADYNHLYTAAFVPDDTRFDAQWGLKTTRFPGAWDAARGRGAKIAIVDSGIDKNHPDVAAKIAEQGVFVADASAPYPIFDSYDHGTHVAGIAAALTDNARGIAGGCPACKLLVAKVLDASGNTTAATLTKGIDWSASQGADVINLSLDGPDNDAVETEVDEARAGGAVIVAAAGNQGSTTPRYPAAYTNVIAVGATNEVDNLATFSNRGSPDDPWVDLVAPGTNILSTGAGGGYFQQDGTSAATPFVSGLAGLLASEGLTASQIRQRMQSTAVDLGPDGDDRLYGHGRINAYRAVP